METINVIKYNKEFELTLCKPNRTEIGILSTANITSINKVIDDINSITFEITDVLFDRFSRHNRKNKLYEEIHNERLIKLNDSELFVIKSVDEDVGDINKKTVNAYSIEHKLNRINISIEDKLIVLVSDDITDSEISIDSMLYSETGWTFGHIDEDVRYDIQGSAKTVKVRWMESMSDKWYTFLTVRIAEMFGCMVVFDTLNKQVNLYSLDKFGDNIGLYLSNDNYMKSIKKQSSTDTIVTRLSLVGKDEIDIRSVNPMGKDYVEDYSYFIDNDDISEELLSALNKHDKIVSDNQVQWELLSNSKEVKDKELSTKRISFTKLCEEINTLISIKTAAQSGNEGDIQTEIDAKNSLKTILESEIRTLELDISSIDSQIAVINSQIDRTIVKDTDGSLLFNTKMLEELNEFLYYDTYSNTAYLTPKDLMDGGITELKKRSTKNIEYNIDSINFMKRVLNNRSYNFKGDISIGDIIILFDESENKEVLLYFVGYEYNDVDGSLNITLSNTKTKTNNTKGIADYLNKAKTSNQFVENKSYLFNQIKFNKI